MNVPFVFTIEEMLDHFIDEGVSPSADDVETAGCRLGRNYYPALVLDLWGEGLLEPAVAAVVVPSAWSAVEFPNRALDDDAWSLLFALAGYTVDGVPAERPEATMRLWRGALPGHRSGWSWTDDRSLAQWFAERVHNGGKGRVWTAEVEPARLLARLGDGIGRAGEAEYVVDARELTIRADSLPGVLRTRCGLRRATGRKHAGQRHLTVRCRSTSRTRDSRATG